MPLDSAEIDELKSAIAVARKRDLNFGLCLGKKSEGTVIVTHRIKGPEILAKQAKKAGETAKLASGTMRVKGKNVMLTCDGDAPAGCARRTKEFLSKTCGLKMKVVILDAAGNLLEQDGDEEEDGAQVPEEAANPDAERWQKAKDQYDPLVAKALSSGKGDPSKLRTVWNYLIQMADEGDPTGALKGIPRVTALIKEASATSDGAASAAAQKWEKLQPAAAKLFDQVMQGAPENGPKLQQVWTAAQEKAGAEAYGAAVKLVESLIPALKAALEAKPKPEGDGQQAKWAVAADKLGPLIADVETAGRGDVAKILSLWQAANSAADNGDHDKAMKAVPAISKLIAEARQAPEVEVDPLQDQWDTMSGPIGERVATLTTSGGPSADKVAKAWALAQSQAEKGDLKAAIATAGKVGAALDKMAPGGQNVGGVSLVKLGRARLEWPGIRDDAHKEVRRLQGLIRDAYKNYPAESSRVSGAVGKLNDVISKLDDTLHQQLDDVLNAQDEDSRKKMVGVVRGTTQTFQRYVDGDDVVKNLDGNSFAPDMAVIAPIRAKLNDIMSALGG